MKTILVTGFDPFGGETVNPAWEAVRTLAEHKHADYRIEARQLPTVFDKSIALLKQYMEETEPDVVLCLGQAGGRATFSVERIAVNVNDARIPDNEGKQPIDTPVVEDGPTGYWTTLPIKAIVSGLKEKGIPASISHSAGTFVCNHVFYGLMHEIGVAKTGVKGGFIHIPYLPEQAAQHPGQPSMALDTIVNGLVVTIETTIATSSDIVEAGGDIS
ncbi:pyroglutamyl-peptidase I [Paenibacillus sp. J5C_2022]|uniref:pyroglutamyl-peptidase I n=1 Tax=Paenibacillus sp. J5C2022 TaxID=2977129 RepID=UPI0021D00CDA|nr:pyroglutamyl-peptidase I [Paenibacillus sp. J5C2022]MCU6711958.1 pyroglutamyl-peptidase I [Paenibacillus sp. J5C2022]